MVSTPFSFVIAAQGLSRTAAHTWGPLQAHFKRCPFCSLFTNVCMTALEIQWHEAIWHEWTIQEAFVKWFWYFVLSTMLLGSFPPRLWICFPTCWIPCPGCDLQGSLTSLSGLSSISSWPFVACVLFVFQPLTGSCLSVEAWTLDRLAVVKKWRNRLGTLDET